MSNLALSDDLEFEPIPGLPARPPAGETILWQGAPSWRGLASRAFHVRKIAAYFAVLMVVCVYTLASGEQGVTSLSLAVLPLLGVAAALLLGALAWLNARSTIYTITNRRIVIRHGVALPLTLNLPFRQIESAGLKLHADGTGDIALRLTAGQRVAFVVLWPHVRPWRLARAEPMLRSVPEAAKVAAMLQQEFAAMEPILVDRPANPGKRPSRAAAGHAPQALA